MIDLPGPNEVKVEEAYEVAYSHLSVLFSAPLDEFLEDGRALQKWITDVVAVQEYHPSTAPLLAQLSELSSRLTIVALMQGHIDLAMESLAGTSLVLEHLPNQIASYGAKIRLCGPHKNPVWGGICMRPWPCPRDGK
ncbi:hypothetical protein ACWELV_04300 [Streptomyces mirabilis]